MYDFFKIIVGCNTKKAVSKSKTEKGILCFGVEWAGDTMGS